MEMTPAGRRTTTPHRWRYVLFLFGLILAILAAAHAAHARLASLEQWRSDPVAHFAGGVPVMTTLDAYYSLRLAKARHDGTFVAHADDPLRHYERLQRSRDASEYVGTGEPAEWAPQRTPRRMPLLAELIAVLIPVAGSAETAGLYLTPVLASLFVIPMFLYAWRLGVPAAGLLGALAGAFAPVYLSRTQIGFVDTDCLNLFFPWLSALLVFSIDRSARSPRVLVTAAALGFALYLYFRWYEKAALSALYWSALAGWLMVQRRGAREIALAVIVCIVCSHPVQLALCADNAVSLLGRYWSGRTTSDGASLVDAMFPNVMETVSELRGPRGPGAVGAVLGHWIPGTVGLLGFCALAIRHWRDCIPLVPILVMGAFTFVSGARFAMYLAPLAGLGLGYLLTVAVRSVGLRLAPGQDASGVSTGDDTRLVAESLATYAVMAVAFFAWVQPAMARAVPLTLPAVPAQDVLAVQRAAVRMPPGARVWTWWDRGFAYSHIAGWTVYHDGSAQYTPQTHVIAHTFASDSPGALRAAMARVDRIGNRGITAIAAQVRERAALLHAITEPETAASAQAAQFVVFSHDMLRSAMAQRYVAGLPIRTKDGAATAFLPLPCSGFRGDRLECGRASVDLAAGRFDDGRTIRRLDIVDGGTVSKRVDYANTSDLVAEIVIGPDRSIEVLLLPDEVYRSNLNRMFLLGEYDRSRFEEVYREVPRLRVYRAVPDAIRGP